MTMRASICGLLFCLPLSPAQSDTGVNDLTKSQPFTVNATVVKGCVLGSGVSDVTTFGTLNFGQLSSLSNAVSVVSSSGAGSVLFRCNPGLSVTLALGVGNHVTGSIAGGRKLQNAATSETLLYQLYQDSNYATLWGMAPTAARHRPSPPPAARKKSRFTPVCFRPVPCPPVAFTAIRSC